MARTSTEAAQMFQRAYDKSKDVIDVVKREPYTATCGSGCPNIPRPSPRSQPWLVRA
jgi:hypothetical protein